MVAPQDQAFARARLTAGDPAPGGKASQGSPLGKTKRLRQVRVYATTTTPLQVSVSHEIGRAHV